MRFREAVTVCIQDYHTFSGRACRSEYWWFFLFCVAGSVLLSGVDAVLFGEDMLLGLNGLFAMLTFLPQIAVAWRRLHDTGRPGWYNFLPTIPLVPMLSAGRGVGGVSPAVATVLLIATILLALLILVWLVQRGQPGPNRFGPVPPS